MTTSLSRRGFLLIAGQATLVGLVTACGQPPGVDPRPLALVYRGPASRSGCPEAVAALLGSAPTSFRTIFVGPEEDDDLSADILKQAVVYAQPGGGTVDSAWRKMRPYTEMIQDWVQEGGHYLGFCLGGYLAGATPGFALLPGDTSQYITSANASLSSTDDSVVPVRWRGKPRHMFFQDGPVFRLNAGANATVLATYDNGFPAAVTAPYGKGSVGVVGAHPEADESWYRGTGLTNPDGINFDLGYDLVQATVRPV